MAVSRRVRPLRFDLPIQCFMLASSTM